MKRGSFALATALLVLACRHEASPPVPPHVVAGTTPDSSATPPTTTTTTPPPAPNEVVNRIISGGDLFVRLEAGCEPVTIDAGFTPEQRKLEVDANGPLGCAKAKAPVAIDVADATNMRALACRDDEKPTPTVTPKANEAVVDGAHLFADRAACDAAVFTPPASPSCAVRIFTNAVKNRSDDIPTGDFVMRFDALIADPQAEVWHRASAPGQHCAPYRVVHTNDTVQFFRTWTEKSTTFTDEATWTYEPKCKAWMPKGTRSSTKTGGMGSSHVTKPASNIRPAPLAAPEHDADTVPFRPEKWFYTRRACERSPR